MRAYVENAACNAARVTDMDIAAPVIAAALEQLRGLPTPVSGWQVETGPDATDDPAVWVWAILEQENVDRATRSRLREIVRDTVQATTGPSIWVYVRFRAASEVEQATWKASTAPSAVPELETVAAKASAEVVVAETTDTRSGPTVAPQSKVSPTYRLIRSLKVLFETPEDERWPGATWPARKAFEDAREFISRLPLADIPEPEIRFADDGEINFLWMTENTHIDLGFFGTGSYSYFGRNSDGREIQDENVPATDGPVKEIVTMLTA